MVALLLVLDGVIGAGVSRYARSVQGQSALNLVEISSVGAGATAKITTQALDDIETIPNVTEVHGWTQLDLAITNESDWPDMDVNPGAVWATPIVPGLEPKVVAGAIPNSGLLDGEIALPDRVPGGSLRKLVGKTVTLEFTKLLSTGVGEPSRREFVVRAIVDNSTPGKEGPAASYVSAGVLNEMFQESATAATGGEQYTSAYVRVARPDDVPAVQRELSRRGFAVSSVADQLSSLGGLFRILSWASKGLLIVLVGFALLIGGSVGASWVNQRRREVGLLSALGWTRRRIALAAVLEALTLGLVAVVGGVMVGSLLSLIATALVSGRQLEVLPVDPWSWPSWQMVGLAMLLVPICLIMGGFRSGVKAVRMDADVALRDLV